MAGDSELHANNKGLLNASACKLGVKKGWLFLKLSWKVWTKAYLTLPLAPMKHC